MRFSSRANFEFFTISTFENLRFRRSSYKTIDHRFHVDARPNCMCFKKNRIGHMIDEDRVFVNAITRTNELTCGWKPYPTGREIWRDA